MSNILKLELILITIVYLVVIIEAIRKRKINISYSIIWIFLGFGMIISVCIPNLINIISSFVGFETPSNMIFALGLLGILFIIFSLTKIVSKQSKDITRLIQEVSILKMKIKNEKNTNSEK